MTIITNYREEVKRFERFFESKPTITTEEILPQLITDVAESTDMVNAAANSLRSPLLALKIYLDLLKNFPQEEKKTDVLNRMKNTTNEMAKKINALARLVDLQNEFTSAIEQVDFSNLLAEVKEELSKVFDLTDIKITTNFEEQNIQANNSELSLLLFHILHNCVTYRQDNQPLHITIKTKKVGNYFLIGVKDNGIGMQLKNDDEAEKLFRPFYKLDKENKGIGIGLSIVRSIVNKYKGEIKVRSRIHEGSMFNVYLKS